MELRLRKKKSPKPPFDAKKKKKSTEPEVSTQTTLQTQTLLGRQMETRRTVPALPQGTERDQLKPRGIKGNGV